MQQRIQVSDQSQEQIEETIIPKQERLFLNSVASVYSRRAYSYFLHYYLKQVSWGCPSLEQFLSRSPKEIEDELIDFVISSKEKGMKTCCNFQLHKTSDFLLQNKRCCYKYDQSKKVYAP